MGINWYTRSYSEPAFVSAWETSTSVAQCARELGLKPIGGNYKTLKATASSLGLNGSHMSGQAWMSTAKTLPERTKKPIESYLVEGQPCNTTHLKKRLIAEGILEEVCAAPFCPVPNPSVNPFTGEPTPLKLILDHINGVNDDNRIDNLRLLCNHCHAETETFCGSNVTHLAPPNPDRTCACGNSKKIRSIKCRDCDAALRLANPRTVIEWGEIVEIIEELRASSYLAVSKRLGVSDNAVRKHVAKRGYDPKTFELIAA